MEIEIKEIVLAYTILEYSYGAAILFATWYVLFRFGKVKIIKVIDGDTVKAKGKVSNLRLYGIDAPETGQKGGKEATEYLRKLVEGKWVRVQVITTCRYGRDVVKILKGGDVNKKMVKAGHAIPYMSKEYEPYRQKVKFTSPAVFRQGGKK